MQLVKINLNDKLLLKTDADIIHFMESDLCCKCGINYYKYGKQLQQFEDVTFLEEPVENVCCLNTINY